MPDPVPPLPPSAFAPVALPPSDPLSALVAAREPGALLEAEVRAVLDGGRTRVAIGGRTFDLRLPATLSPGQTVLLRVLTTDGPAPVLQLLANPSSPGAESSPFPETPAALLAPSLMEALGTGESGSPAELSGFAARAGEALRRFGVPVTPESLSRVVSVIRETPDGRDAGARASAAAATLRSGAWPTPPVVEAIARLIERPGELAALVERLQNVLRGMGRELSATDPTTAPAERKAPASPGSTGAPPSPEALRPFISPGLLPAIELSASVLPEQVRAALDAVTRSLPAGVVADPAAPIRAILESSPSLRALDLALSGLVEGPGVSLSGEALRAGAGPEAAVSRLMDILKQIATSADPDGIAARIESEWRPQVRAEPPAVRAALRQAIEALETETLRGQPGLRLLREATQAGNPVLERLAAVRWTQVAEASRGDPPLRAEVPVLIDGRWSTLLLEGRSGAPRDREGRRPDGARTVDRIFIALELTQLGWVTAHVDFQRKTATARFRVRDSRVRRLLWKHRGELTASVASAGLRFLMEVSVDPSGGAPPLWGPSADPENRPSGLDVKG